MDGRGVQYFSSFDKCCRSAKFLTMYYTQLSKELQHQHTKSTSITFTMNRTFLANLAPTQASANAAPLPAKLQ